MRHIAGLQMPLSSAVGGFGYQSERLKKLTAQSPGVAVELRVIMLAMSACAAITRSDPHMPSLFLPSPDRPKTLLRGYTAKDGTTEALCAEHDDALVYSLPTWLGAAHYYGDMFKRRLDFISGPFGAAPHTSKLRMDVQAKTSARIGRAIIDWSDKRKQRTRKLRPETMKIKHRKETKLIASLISELTCLRLLLEDLDINPVLYIEGEPVTDISPANLWANIFYQQFYPYTVNYGRELPVAIRISQYDALRLIGAAGLRANHQNSSPKDYRQAAATFLAKARLGRALNIATLLVSEAVGYHELRTGGSYDVSISPARQSKESTHDPADVRVMDILVSDGQFSKNAFGGSSFLRVYPLAALRLDTVYTDGPRDLYSQIDTILFPERREKEADRSGAQNHKAACRNNGLYGPDEDFIRFFERG